MRNIATRRRHSSAVITRHEQHQSCFEWDSNKQIRPNIVNRACWIVELELCHGSQVYQFPGISSIIFSSCWESLVQHYYSLVAFKFTIFYILWYLESTVVEKIIINQENLPQKKLFQVINISGKLLIFWTLYFLLPYHDHTYMIMVYT